MFYRMLKGFKNEKEFKLQTIKAKDKKVLVEEEEIVNRWKEYFEELLNKEDTEGTEDEGDIELSNELPQNHESLITRKELDIALRKIKPAKAPGVDEVAPEFIKYLGERGRKELLDIMNEAWERGIIPEDWKYGVILPIHKKGDSKECDNYRGITLLTTALKVYETILECRLRERVEKKLSDIQSGFRPDHSIQDHIFTVQQVLEKKLAKNKKVFTCFIDMKKAFDSISRAKIWESLRKKGVDEGLVRAIKSIYKETYNVVRTCNVLSEKFKTSEGVRQGSVLSPLLFICAMDDAIRHCQERMQRFRVGYRELQPTYLQACAFADDIVLFANSEENMQKSVKIWKDALAAQKLELNVEKTKVVMIGNEAGVASVTADGEVIEQVQAYKYLGSVINSRGNSEDELMARIKAANRLYAALRRKFLDHKEITQETKISIFKSMYLPVLLHGGENWILTGRQEKQIQAMEMKYLRRVIGARRIDKKRNEDIRKQLHVKSAKLYLEEKKLRWFGHLVRMEENRQVKKIWETRPEGKNKRGRPKTTWNATVEKILIEAGETWHSAKHIARDRTQWRNFTRR